MIVFFLRLVLRNKYYPHRDGWYYNEATVVEDSSCKRTAYDLSWFLVMINIVPWSFPSIIMTVNEENFSPFNEMECVESDELTLNLKRFMILEDFSVNCTHHHSPSTDSVAVSSSTFLCAISFPYKPFLLLRSWSHCKNSWKHPAKITNHGNSVIEMERTP